MERPEQVSNGDRVERPEQVSDGKRIVSADELKGGQLYVLSENESGGHLRQIPRSDDELPRVRITEEALTALREFCQGMRKQLGGYRPDMTLACSALITWAVAQPDAPAVLRNFVIAKFLQGDEGPEHASTRSVEDDPARVEI